MRGRKLGREGRAARGQLLLATAVLLAVLLVGLALVVNGAIYSEQRSARASGDADEAAVATATALETVAELLDRTNANHNASYGDATRNFTAMVDGIRTAHRDPDARSGGSLRLSIEGRTNGTHVRQTNESRDFTDAVGAASDWTVVENASLVTDGRLTVRRDRLYAAGGPLEAGLDDSFAVHVTNASGAAWTLHVYENADDEVAVRTVRDGAVQSPCTVDAAAVDIDLVAGTVGAEPCATLSFGAGLEGAVDIDYRNPDRVSGTYEFRVDRVLAPSTDRRYEPRGAGSPSATPTIAAATVRVASVDGEVTVTRRQELVAGDAVYTA